MIPNGALVLYKHKAAVASLDGDKASLRFVSGESIRVRPKDVELVHPGPVAAVPAPRSGGDFETAWQMAQGDSLDLAGLCELVFGDYAPDSALACHLELDSGGRFSLQDERILAIGPEEREREAQKQARKQGEAQEREAFVERARKGRIEEGDARWLAEVEGFALGRSARSKLVAELGIKDEPAAAHAWLLKAGRWDASVDPYPARAGLPLKAPLAALAQDDDSGRIDLRALESWAIDNAWSKDPDDAIAWDGQAVWVHVADPASVVLPGTEADREAADRSGTLYLPTGSIPMLPDAALERFGLGLAEESRALSVRIEVAADGSVREVSVTPSFVRVRRSSYGAADALLGSGPLRALDEIARVREALRAAAGAIDIDLPELHVWVEGGRPCIEPSHKTRSQVLVREMMILAGEAVARWAFERELPYPYYSQEAPSEPGTLPDGLAGEFAKRRLMRGGMAGVQPRAHRGLGVSFYAQSTSPLRRYADLLGHQQLRAFLSGREPLPADEVSERLGRAAAAGALLRQAERASELHWTLAWLTERPDWSGEATVVGSGPGGLSLFVNDLGLETRIRGDERALNELVGVRLVGLDLAAQELRFALA